MLKSTAFWALCWLCAFTPTLAQGVPAPAQGESALALRRKQVQLREARDLVERRKELRRQDLISEMDLRRAETALELARLDYHEAVLEALRATPRISVLRAVKSQDADGRLFVNLTIANLTPAIEASRRHALEDFGGGGPLPRELLLGTVSDVFVSLKDNGRSRDGVEVGVRGTTIGLPYEVHVPRLDYREEKDLKFQLLKDVDSLIVSVEHGARRQEIDLQLQQAETRNAVSLTSTQVSQEGDLGSQVTYLLRLERSTVDVRGFQLKALNLPRQVSSSFIDPATDARLSRFSFPSGVTQRTLGLRLYLPERLGEGLRIDEPLPFWAVVVEDSEVGPFREERGYSDEEVESSRAGRVRLEVIPRGVGRIEASATSLFAEIAAGESANTELTIRNTGTRRLDNVALAVQGPLRWTVRVTPELIPALEVDQERRVQIGVSSPLDAPVGDYEVRIGMESHAYGRPVPSEEKILRVTVSPSAGLWSAAALVAGLLATISGLLFVGVRYTKR